MKNKKRKTIPLNVLLARAFCNSKKLPQLIEHEGQRKRWVGIGWVTEGKPTGRETLVV